MTGAPLAIGLDLGGTQLRAALVSRSGEVLKRTAVATAASAGPEAVVGQLAEVAREIAEGVALAEIAGVGISAPGPLDAVNGRIIWAPTLAGFRDVPIAALLAQRLGLPVRLENDGIAAALGEWRFGAGRALSNLAYVTVSTGIGGGVVCDGRVLRGRRGMAGHVGHMTIVEDGDICSCGNSGCWEAYASGTAFTRRARLRATDAADTLLGEDMEAIDARRVFEAAARGDPLAGELVAEEADYLGIGIANLLHLYSPDIVIIGGGMANGFGEMQEGIARRVQRSAMPAFRDVPVVRAELGDNSGLIGAAAMVFGEG
ncbi:ROK family protein [Arvimicrobium flavum]|uniref:ROK family protein n=1 Tax=Arvimicrobium flavum TaxID=3393320 RepID=UPI00237B9D8C|nr:ROK family protein [Mesorhizobium shangrilense]